jgi:hypothetical protein
VVISLALTAVSKSTALKHMAQLCLAEVAKLERMVQSKDLMTNVAARARLDSFQRYQAIQDPSAVDRQGNFLFPSVLCVRTDNGPDHNPTFAQIIIAYFMLFLMFDIDRLVISTSTPGQSSLNAHEAVLSALNCVWKHVGLARTACADEEVEKLVQACSSASEMRELIDKNKAVDTQFQDALKPVRRV